MIYLQSRAYSQPESVEGLPHLGETDTQNGQKCVKVGGKLGSGLPLSTEELTVVNRLTLTWGSQTATLQISCVWLSLSILLVCFMKNRIET